MLSSPTPSLLGPHVTRRTFVLGGAALAAAALLPVRAAARRMGFAAYPFALGVASGEPSHDGFALWTRLAPRPLDPDGGMTPEPVAVKWSVAHDEGFARIAARGDATATADWAHSVHVEVSGLEPGRWYWYRFEVGGTVSPTGRVRTLPAADELPDRLRFAFASCQKYEVGYFTAYEHLVREEIDFVVFLGDYIYENADDPKGVRKHGLAPCRSLTDYRLRYSAYKLDAALQRAHEHAPWIATWDDHEVGNDYAGAVYAQDPALRARRTAAYRAYYEHMPLRRISRPDGPDLQLYRRFNYGRLAQFQVLDTRQYRTAMPPGPRLQAIGPAHENPSATLMGAAQREWLFDGLAQSPARWNVLAQQVLMARVDRVAGPEVVVDVDKWAGYEFERRRLLRHLRDARIRNPVVLTGDKHNNWANELALDFEAPARPPVAAELLGTSISSGGDGADRPDYLATLLAENPCVKYHNNERGYVRCEVTPTTWRADFQTVPYVSRRGAPLQTRASFVLSDGSSVLQRA